jgi:endonuclease YncB( thermonuclease family)
VRCGAPGEYRQVTIRIAEIDAPEKKQPFGQRSKESLSDLCFQIEAVVTPETKDRYGRTVARVSCNGQDVSLHQARAGMAWWYVKYGRDGAIRDAEQQARAGRIGLWSDTQPLAPWVFRHP